MFLSFSVTASCDRSLVSLSLSLVWDEQWNEEDEDEE